METKDKQDLEKLVKEAKDGTMADKIRSLDLSQKEGRDELRYLMSPWSGGCQDIMPQGGKIYNADGTKLFPNDYAETHLSYGIDGMLNLENHLREFEAKYNFDSKVDDDDIRSAATAIQTKNGHGIVKMHYYFRDDFKVSEEDINVHYFSYAAGFVGETLNYAPTGSAFYQLLSCKESQNIKKNPNYPFMEKLSKKHLTFFKEWNEVFFKYLSHQLQGQKIIYDKISVEDSTKVERDYEDFEDSGYASDKRHAVNYNHAFTRLKIERGFFDERLNEIVREYIDNIDRYTNVLKDFNESVPYAVPTPVQINRDERRYERK